MTDLTRDELLDAAEQGAAVEQQRHLSTCEACRTEVSTLAAVLHQVRNVDMPEPSPLVWQHFSTRVKDAIRIESSVDTASRRPWWRWSVLVPAASAVLAVTLALAIDRVSLIKPGSGGAAPAATGDETTPPEDTTWLLVAELAADLDLDEAHRAGLTITGVAVEQAVADLTTAERAELLRLLHAELRRTPGS